MAELVLVAGATGALGRHVGAALRRQGHRVRALTRDPARLSVPSQGERAFDEVFQGDALDPAALARACEGVSAVFSCLGASVAPSLAGRAAYTAVDTPANLNLLREARARPRPRCSATRGRCRWAAPRCSRGARSCP